VVKLYLTIHENERKSHIEEIFNWYNKLTNKEGTYSFNWRKGKPISKDGFYNYLSVVDPKSFENLSIISNDENVMIGMSSLLKYDPDLFYIELAFPVEKGLKNIFLDFSRNIAGLNNAIIYGYGRELPKDYFPSSETKIKKTFGGTSIQVEQIEKTWLRTPSYKTNMLKGVYPLNLLRREQLQDKLFSSFMDNNIGHIEDINSEVIILEFDSNELRQIRTEYPELSEFVRK
jgi:hypothetical protein